MVIRIVLNLYTDINVGSALFTKAYKEKGAWGVGASFFSQGKIRGMSEEGLPTGRFYGKGHQCERFLLV